MIHKRLAFTFSSFFFFSVTLKQQATHAFQSSPSVCKTSQSHHFSSGLTTTSLCASNNDNREKDGSSANEKYNNRKELNRRNAILTTSAAAFLSTTSLTRSPSRANAEFLPDITNVFGSSSADGVDGYKPAKRATAYLVDSTFPPTLIPQKSASREKKILSQIGSGMGTSKSPFIDEGITLNNMMKKAVYGTADTVSSLLNSSSMNKKGPSFCFLGVNTLTDEEGVSLAESLIQEMLKARSSQGAGSTAIGLSFVPKLSGQSILDAYVKGEINSETALLEKMEEIASVPKEIMSSQLPLINLAKKENINNNKNKLQLVALGPEIIDLNTVRREGLQNVDLGRRSKYVLDTQGFIELTQNPRFKLYTEKSMLKDFIPLPDKQDDKPADFFAQRIMQDEAIASSIAEWSVIPNSSSSNNNNQSSSSSPFMIVISDVPHVRYMGGANMRVPRIMKYLTNGDSAVDEESVTTILLNPTPETTLSLSKYLRLEIGTAPDNWDYQTKVADYLWFSKMPQVNMLPRMMRS